MTHKLIKINEDHYIVVDNSEIKEDCYALHEGPLGEREIVTANGQCKLDKKITHSTIPKGMMLMEGVKRLSLQEVKELLGEVDVEMSAFDLYESLKKEYFSTGQKAQLPQTDKERRAICDGFILGYNQAIEDNKEKKYTEEDMRKIFIHGKQLGLTVAGAIRNGSDIPDKDMWYNESIQSLQPKTEWEVEFVDGKLKLK